MRCHWPRVKIQIVIVCQDLRECHFGRFGDTNSHKEDGCHRLLRLVCIDHLVGLCIYHPDVYTPNVWLLYEVNSLFMCVMLIPTLHLHLHKLYYISHIPNSFHVVFLPSPSQAFPLRRVNPQFQSQNVIATFTCPCTASPSARIRIQYTHAAHNTYVVHRTPNRDGLP